MKIFKILEEKENVVLNRKEVKMVVEADKNPNFPESLKLISEHFKVGEELIAVKEIQGKFGRGTFLITSYLYGSKEEKDKTEPKVKPKKGAKS